MTPLLGMAVALGCTLGLGLWTLVGLTPRISRPRLAARLAPYLADISSEARTLARRRTVEPLPVLGVLTAPAIDSAVRTVAALFGGADRLSLRLRQSRAGISLERYRLHQLGCLVLGALTGAVGGLVAAQTRPLSPVVLLALPVVTALAAVLVRDQLLARAARSRVQRMTSELPTVLEFLSLSLSAGEGILDSLRRVGRADAGELPRELGGVVTAVASGIPLSVALESLSRELAIPPLARAVDQVIGALERGSPLVEVLRAQAQDCRDEAKRDLLEVAGRKEVTMLVPLVFLILPTTVLIAIFPGILVLQTGF